MIKRRSTLALLAGAGSLGLARARSTQAAPAVAVKPEQIAIIGTGEVGSALGRRLAVLGHTIVYGSRTPQDARVLDVVKATPGAIVLNTHDAGARADLILFAVPWGATNDVVDALGDLGGKVLIDPTNPVKLTGGHFDAPPDMARSGGEQLQLRAAAAHVVKAFNTLSAEIMTDSGRAGGPVTVPLAGADAAAKARVAQIVSDMALEPLDVGDISTAGTLEAMARLRMSFHAKNRPAGFEFFLRPA